jgi:hypothetical protein
MDFENLIWIAAVLIYVASAILKKKRIAERPEAAGKPKKSPEWREKLDRYLALIKQEIKTELEGAAAEKEIRREVTAAPAVFAAAPKSRFEKEAVIEALKVSVDELPHETGSVKPETEIEKSEHPDRASKFVIKDLRNAIIWSEILGPPVALRNQ